MPGIPVVPIPSPKTAHGRLRKEGLYSVHGRPRKEPLYSTDAFGPKAGSYEWIKQQARRICAFPGDPGSLSVFKNFKSFGRPTS